MLLNNFYQIKKKISHEGGDWSVSIELTPNHSLYEGHFPEHPIVPGVCVMQFIKECTTDIISRELQYEYVSSCKFLLALNPIDNRELELQLSFKELDDSRLQLQAEGTCGDTSFVKLKATLLYK